MCATTLSTADSLADAMSSAHLASATALGSTGKHLDKDGGADSYAGASALNPLIKVALREVADAIALLGTAQLGSARREELPKVVWILDQRLERDVQVGVDESAIPIDVFGHVVPG